MVKYKINSIIFTILFAILIFILSVMPTDINGEPPPFYFKGLDKLIHLLMYGVLSFLVINEYLKRRPLKILPVIVLIFITWIYSILMELVQYFFVDYRSGEILDGLANIIGIVSAALILTLYKKFKS